MEVMKHQNRKKMQTGNPLHSLFPMEVKGFSSLAELALDLHWSWSHTYDELWQQLDPTLWELTHNPWTVLQATSREKIKKLLSDPIFRKTVANLIRDKRNLAEESLWFQNKYPNSKLKCVAYFSMEFMLSEALPIYSGGLGNVAGDHLKAASDLGMPIIGIGLLYQQGYFRQLIGRDGTQHALFPYNDPGQLPITPVRQANGEWLRFEVPLPGYSVWMRAWQAQIGRTTLYLLDSNDPANFPVFRGITSELYGGDAELRLKQEMLLGMGGWRLLNILDIHPEVYHLNEGHAALAVLERARDFKDKTGLSFAEALAITRAGNLFTSHTAVPAAFDHFHPLLMEAYLGSYAKYQLGIEFRDFLALGRQNPEDPNEDFNMAYLAIRGSGAVNGVSRLHGKVSRNLFNKIFPHWPEHEIPIGYVTNGIHVPSWDSKEADKIWLKACGKQHSMEQAENVANDIRCVPDEDLWQMRNTMSKNFIDYIRDRLYRQLAASGFPETSLTGIKNMFSTGVLTLGFARRFATYKRPNLLLHDPQRLLRILSNPERPAQLVIAGKAHPADIDGQIMIKEWIRFIRTPEARPYVMFLSDYDMLLTEHMVQGVDVWINTPRRPWEACGTSGMKVLVNGGLNLSELDGWWAEAYSPEVGWALGDGKEHDDDPAWDAEEAEKLYDLLEYEVIPEFYNRNEKGIPAAWVMRMRESMARLTQRFSSTRSAQEYMEKHYIPAAEKYHKRAEDNAKFGKQLVVEERLLQQKWNDIYFAEVKVDVNDTRYVFEARVHLGNLSPDLVQVEIYADARGSSKLVKNKMILIRAAEISSAEPHVYQLEIDADRPVNYYTARIIPNQQRFSTPLEIQNILWQR
jgi:starch phosphorylase